MSPYVLRKPCERTKSRFEISTSRCKEQLQSPWNYTESPLPVDAHLTVHDLIPSLSLSPLLLQSKDDPFQPLGKYTRVL